MNKKKKKMIDYGRYGYFFIAPFFITYLVFQLWPLINTFYYSTLSYYKRNGREFMEFFLPLADGLDASMVTAEDQQILSLMDTQTKAYATGEKDLDTALADLTASIHDTFSYLSAE